MQRKRTSDGSQESDRSLKRGPDISGERSRSEELHIRSYDHQWSYDLDVELVDDEGETLFRERYYMLPDSTESEGSIVPSGQYELHAILDNGERETFPCRIDSNPEHTAVIEVGNGALALSEGIQN